MIIGAQEIMHALRGAVHVGIGLARRVVPLIMFARTRQRREFAMHGILRLGPEQAYPRYRRQLRRAGERRAHQRDRSKHVGPHQRAPGGDRTAEIMSDHGIDAAIAECRHQAERVAHQIEQPERSEIAVVVGVPAGGAAVAALVRRDHVIAGFRQRRHHLAPAIGEFGKAVQQQHAGPALCLEAGFQHMHAQAVDVVDEARADAGRKGMSGRSVVVFMGRALRSSW